MERAELIACVSRTGCAEQAGPLTFLVDPKWTTRERVYVDGLLAKARAFPADDAVARGWLCIPTGGTTGGIKFARHDEETLAAAVGGFCTFFDLGRVNTVDVLPPHHVSGFMARVRSAATDGRHVSCDWKKVENGHFPELSDETDGWVISLVPTQLQRLLGSAEATAWLKRFRIIFVGGGPIWPDLQEAAADQSLRISLTYGMTETAAMVAAVPPTAFLEGQRKWARPLPHARIGVTSEGVIEIAGASVHRGYFPDEREAGPFVTHDLGELRADGALRVIGRRDAVIISGGKKIQPQEVEAALRASGAFSDVAVIGVPDAQWGEIVVACFPAGGSHFNRGAVERGLEQYLAPFKRPKQYVAIDPWPRNAQGKLNRAALVALAGRT